LLLASVAGGQFGGSGGGLVHGSVVRLSGNAAISAIRAFSVLYTGQPFVPRKSANFRMKNSLRADYLPPMTDSKAVPATIADS
jgi:hypothetical protein